VVEIAEAWTTRAGAAGQGDRSANTVTAAAMGSGHGLRGFHRKNAWLCEKIVGWPKRPWG